MSQNLSFRYYLEFEHLVKEVFTHSGYRTSSQPRSHARTSHSGPDMLLIDGQGLTVAVEIKLYRSDRPPFNQMLRAVNQVRNYMAGAGAQRGIVVFSSDFDLDDARVNRIFDNNVEAIGMRELVKMAGSRMDLVQKLEDLFRSSRIESLTPKAEAAHDFFGALSGNFIVSGDEAAQSETVSAETAAIEALIVEFKQCPKGKGKGPQYEAVGEKVVKELFGDDLGVLKRQSRIAEGYQVVDLIASIKPVSKFWEALRSDFRSRYVIFEFKNYTKKISQEQIFSTEKYLFRSALRSVAFIIARSGEDYNAGLARRGALREAGKLIVTLSHAELTKMLEMKRDAEDYIIVIADKLDDMLTSLER